MRRVEMVSEHSKKSFSVMFCGNAEGLFLPPMVVFKAKKGGPSGKLFLKKTLTVKQFFH